MLTLYIIASTKAYFANSSGNRMVVERRNVESGTASKPPNTYLSCFLLNWCEVRKDPCSGAVSGVSSALRHYSIRFS